MKTFYSYYFVIIIAVFFGFSLALDTMGRTGESLLWLLAACLYCLFAFKEDTND
jgi:hypothetical protein